MSTADSSQVESVIYPESDGMPMGETDLHIHWIIRLRDILKCRYRETQTYVASNLLVYYDEGVPRHFVVPDVFVVLDCDPSFRRVYKTWEEPKPPQVVFEITSASTRRDDEVRKPEKYENIGVLEYFLYDPTSEYLSPALRGFRRGPQGFQPIEMDSSARLSSEILGVTLELNGGELVLRDSVSENVLLTHEELSEQQARNAEQKAHDAEQKAHDAEQKAHDAERKALDAERKALDAERKAFDATHEAHVAKERNEALEAELRRLRERLGEV